MDEVKIWAIDDSSAAVPLESKSQVDTESLLEETLVRNPDLLIPGLKLVGRQTPMEGGALDLLGVDKGKLVVFELKRGALSREAVAQVIDYASSLEAMDPAELAWHISDGSGEHGIEKIKNFQEWYSQDYGGLEGLRPLRMFLVGLGADETTERMVDFLADNSSMDISLLTFHGFVYDGKTLLAKQVRVEGTTDIAPPSARRYLTVAETREKLERRKAESGVSELFDVVRDMFRENWHGLGEGINVGSLRLSLWEPSESRCRAYARIAPDPGRVLVIFYIQAFNLCPGEFEKAKEAVQYETWGSDEWPELVFPLDTAGWETHRELLHKLTQAVYAAWENREQDEGPPDPESSSGGEI